MKLFLRYFAVVAVMAIFALPWPASAGEVASSPYSGLDGVELLDVAMPHRHSRDIAQSSVGIGFETLDRRTFDPKWTFPLIGECGVKWARCQTGWIRCEKEKGKYDFFWLDEVVDSLAAQGVETWFSLSFGNPLWTPCEKFDKALQEGRDRGEIVPGWARGYVGENPICHGPEAMAAWLKYVRAIARHFKGRVRVWELWNEPEWFFRYKNEPVCLLYGNKKAVELFESFMRQTAAALRAEIPDARISYNSAVLSCDWLPYLAQLKVTDYIDIYNLHGYEQIPEAALSASVAQARALLKKPDGSPIEIWQGESGRATGPAANGPSLPSQFSQARFIARRIAADWSEGLGLSSIFTVTDFLKYYPDGRNQYYGVLDGETREPKKGYWTLQTMAWLGDGLRRAPEHWLYFKTVKWHELVGMTPYAAVRTASFERKGRVVYAFWQQEHVELDAKPLRGTLRFVTGRGGMPFAHPILIDPVRRQIWDLSKRGIVDKDKRGIYEIVGIYALDYPLFLTDKAALAE